MWQLPKAFQLVSRSLKIDDPFTLMRIGRMSHFYERFEPISGGIWWSGLAWAEVFLPVVGERPESVVGEKAFEVCLKRPISDGGKIVRENVATTGRLIGVVVSELSPEIVTLQLEKWFVKGSVFKKGRWLLNEQTG